MKIGNVEVTKCEEILVLPRADGRNIVFKAVPVSINDEFDNMVPEPVPPVILKKGGKQADLTDANYVETVSRRGDLRFAFLMLKSIEPSEIEWSQVDMKKPATWTKWNDELREAGLSEAEVNRVIGTVMVANSLDEAKIKAARDSFLLGQAE